MDFNLILPYLLGAVAVVVAHRFGIQVPMLPVPTTPSPFGGTAPAPAPAPVQQALYQQLVPPPAPPPLPPAERPSTIYLHWLLQVKAGLVKLDDLDRIGLDQVQSVLKDLPR